MIAAKDDDIDDDIDDNIEKRNQYRIASISKSFIGYFANYLVVNHNLNLDAKVCFLLLILVRLSKSETGELHIIILINLVQDMLSRVLILK